MSLAGFGGTPVDAKLLAAADHSRYDICCESLRGEEVANRAASRVRSIGLGAVDGEKLSPAIVSKHLTVTENWHGGYIVVEVEGHCGQTCLFLAEAICQAEFELLEDPHGVWRQRFLDRARRRLSEPDWQDFKSRNSANVPGYQLRPNPARPILSYSGETGNSRETVTSPYAHIFVALAFLWWRWQQLLWF